MNVARDLLNDLAEIGATIEPAGDRLILRAGLNAIPATLVSRVREAKPNLLAALANHRDRAGLQTGEARGHVGNPPHHQVDLRDFEACIIGWLNQHPAPSAEERCAWCGRPETPSAMVLPFGAGEHHAWLHAECWPAWHQRRRVEADMALRKMGLAPGSSSGRSP